mmetsp:Transcript_36447/g.46422  ORF Transcript_36447/g.46422 Transcript_36447/m.46422 type:complete len:136 (+) Transcript_36447:180-587(+)
MKYFFLWVLAVLCVALVFGQKEVSQEELEHIRMQNEREREEALAQEHGGRKRQSDRERDAALENDLKKRDPFKGGSKRQNNERLRPNHAQVQAAIENIKRMRENAPERENLPDPDNVPDPEKPLDDTEPEKPIEP